MTTPTQKFCNRCQTIKNISEYRPSKTNKKFGLHSYCNDCMKAANKKYYEANKAAILEKAKQKTKEYKAKQTDQKHTEQTDHKTNALS